MKCPCQSTLHYQNCCEQYHLGQAAPSAQALMRSRYSAYTLNLASYLLATWHPNTRPASLDLASDAPTQWLSLTIKDVKLLSENTATVEFIARYKVNGKAYKLHEVSEFIRDEACWYYVTGSFKDA